TGAGSDGSSALMLMNSKSREPNFREVSTSSGNSLTQGAHQVAQTLMSRTFLLPFFRRAATPAASMVSTSTGVASHFAIFSATAVFLLRHLVEQPMALVTSTGTGFPARRASTALRASGDFTVESSPPKRESSKRPL